MNKLLLLCVVALVLCGNADAAFYTVTSTADNTDSATHGGSGTVGSPFQMSSLRGATIAANAIPGSTITLPAGTYQLTIAGDANDRNFVTFDPTKGDLNVNASGITIQGAGPASTFIQQTTGADRVLVDNASSTPFFNFTLTGVTMTGGRETETGLNLGGAGMFVGAISNITTISNCVFLNNKIMGSGSLGGGAIVNTGGDLNVIGCTFGGLNATDPNVSISSGGAISFDSSDFVHNGGTGTLTVTNSTFINNQATNGSGGGAITVSDSNLSTAIANISGCTFRGNKTSGSGGAIVMQTGTLTVTASTFITNSAQGGAGAIYGSGTANSVHFSRFIGNTSSTPANGNTLNAQAATLNADNNWWGQNSGTAANDVTANVTHNTWLQLRHTANPSTIFVPNSSTLTATFLTNSAGTFIPVANLSQLIGLPITFNNAVRGTLSGAQTAIQASGTATATFTATYAGAGTADAIVDNQTTTATITIPTGVSSINRVQTTPTNLSSVQWTVTFSNAVTGVTAGNFSLVNGGLGGAPGISSVAAVGGLPAASWTVTASTGSGTGTLGLNMVNGTGVASIVNLPFTGQVYTIDLVAPDTSITAQPPAITNNTAASFSFTGSDTGVGVASFQTQLDGAAYTTATSPVNFTGLSSASHTFNVRAIDGAGNTDASPATVTWTVDTIPPTVNCSTDLVVTASGPTAVNFNVSVSDNVALANATTNPASGSIFPVGSTTVTLTARDTAGNTNFCTFKVTVNRPPVAGSAFTMGVKIGVPSTVKIIGGKHSPTDADNDPLTITGVTGAANGIASTDGTNVTYTATGGSSDSFACAISDGRGGTASQTVSVSITSSGSTGYNQISAQSLGGGTNVLTFLGTPNFNYALERATNLVPPVVWLSQVTNAAQTNGWLIFTNVTSESPVFYRTRYVP